VGKESGPLEPTRRELLEAAAGLGAAGVAALAGWGAVEWLVPEGTAASWHDSVCRYCGTGCAIRVGLDADGVVTDVRARDDGTNLGMMCVKGSLLPVLAAAPGRLARPRIREHGTLRDATWEEAMALVASRFREAIATSGPDAVAFYGSGQLFTEESYTANKLFKAGIGTNNVDGNPRLCMASAAYGYVQTFGKDEPCGAYVDLDEADLLFMVGANPMECHPPLMERVLRRRRAGVGPTMICVDPRRTPTAAQSDIHLQVVPGSDLLLLNAMAHVIVERGLVDRPFVDAHVAFSDGAAPISFDDFRGFLADYAPTAVAARVGVPAERIEEVAFRFARAGASTSLWTMGVNQRTQGVALNTMLSSLHLLTGQICRPGATPLSLTGQCNACGGVRDTGSLAHLLPGGRLVANAADRAEMERLWHVPAGRISPRPGLDAVRLFRAMEEGTVQCCLVMCTNPAQSLPDATRYRRGMERSFLVVSDAFEGTETAEYADVLLPAALWIEKEGVYGQTERRYQLVQQLREPPAEARSDLAMLVDLAERLGHGALITARTPEDVWNEWRVLSATTKYDFSGITYERLRQLPGLQWPCPSEDHPGTVRRYTTGDPFVPAGREVYFYGKPDGRAVVYTRPYVPSPEAPSVERPFILTTGRVLEQWHTGTMTERVPELKRAAGPARFEVSPADALELGIATDDVIEVESRFGAVRGAALVSDRPRYGVVFAAFYDVALLINDAVSDAVDPVSGQPEYKVTAVSVRRVSA